MKIFRSFVVVLLLSLLALPVSAFAASNSETEAKSFLLTLPSNTVMNSATYSGYGSVGVQYLAGDGKTVSYQNNAISFGSASSFNVTYAVKYVVFKLQPGSAINSVAFKSGSTSLGTYTVFEEITVSKVTGLTGEAGDGTVSLSWSSQSGVTGYRVYRDGEQILEVASPAANISGLTNGTSYTFTVTAYNSVAESPQSEGLVLTPKRPPDVTPPSAPVLKGVAVEGGYDLSWSGSTDNVGVVSYDLYNLGTKVNAQPITSLSYEIRGLGENVQKSYVVRAIDAAGNISSASNTVELTTKNVTPPDKPTLSGSAGNGTVSLTWTSSQASDLAGYNLYRNGVKLNEELLTTRLYTDQTVTNGVKYTYEVTAVDRGGLESTKSNSVIVTPQLKEMQVQLVPNGNSVIVRIMYGDGPYTIKVDDPAMEFEIEETVYYITGLSQNVTYTVHVMDKAGSVYTGTVNTGSKTSVMPPILPSSDDTMQKMVNGFTEAGRIGLIIIGSAVSLGVIVILARWAFRLTKRWLARAH